jgi:hypothetical protein
VPVSNFARTHQTQLVFKPSFRAVSRFQDTGLTQKPLHVTTSIQKSKLKQPIFQTHNRYSLRLLSLYIQHWYLLYIHTVAFLTEYGLILLECSVKLWNSIKAVDCGWERDEIRHHNSDPTSRDETGMSRERESERQKVYHETSKHYRISPTLYVCLQWFRKFELHSPSVCTLLNGFRHWPFTYFQKKYKQIHTTIYQLNLH